MSLGSPQLTSSLIPARLRWFSCLCCALSHLLAADAPAPKFDTAADLEAFVFPADQDKIADSVKSAFAMNHAGSLVTAAAKLGPAYASKVAATINYPEFREPYRDLAKYLDLFGPCQKKQSGETTGWWSSYGESPGEAWCTEVIKLVFGNMLWSQVHYCRQLLTGEVKPKFITSYREGPPWRLDESPVKTEWLMVDVLYAIADAAVRFTFQKSLRKHAEMLDAREYRVRQDCLEAATELEKESPSRELIALAIGKVLIRNYESSHLRHLDTLREKNQKPDPTIPRP